MRNPSKNTIKRLKKKFPSKFKGKKLVLETAKNLIWWERIVRRADKVYLNINWD